MFSFHIVGLVLFTFGPLVLDSLRGYECDHGAGVYKGSRAYVFPLGRPNFSLSLRICLFSRGARF